MRRRAKTRCSFLPASVNPFAPIVQAPENPCFFVVGTNSGAFSILLLDVGSRRQVRGDVERLERSYSRSSRRAQPRHCPIGGPRAAYCDDGVRLASKRETILPGVLICSLRFGKRCRIRYNGYLVDVRGRVPVQSCYGVFHV